MFNKMVRKRVKLDDYFEAERTVHFETKFRQNTRKNMMSSILFSSNRMFMLWKSRHLTYTDLAECVIWYYF